MITRGVGYKKAMTNDYPLLTLKNINKRVLFFSRRRKEAYKFYKDECLELIRSILRT